MNFSEKNYENLAMSIKDDIKDMEMYLNYAKEAVKENDMEMLKHWYYKTVMRKDSMNHSHRIAVEMVKREEDTRSDTEKMYHNCLHKILMSDMQEIDKIMMEMQRKL